MLKQFDDAPRIDEINSLTEKDRKKFNDHGVSYLNKLRSGKESEISIAKVYGKGKPYFKNKETFYNEIKADDEKPIAIVMANCWPDFPNGYGPCNFTDYVDWFLFTFETIKKIDSCNWVLKPHPGENFYGQNTTLKN